MRYQTLVIQDMALLVHTSYTLSHLCRAALVASPDRPYTQADREARESLTKICIDNAFAASEGYVDLLRLAGYTYIAIRSWHLIHNGLAAFVILGTLGEFRRNASARAIVDELLFRAPLFDKGDKEAPPTWTQKVLQRLRTLSREAETATVQETTFTRDNEFTSVLDGLATAMSSPHRRRSQLTSAFHHRAYCETDESGIDDIAHSIELDFSLIEQSGMNDTGGELGDMEELISRLE